MFDDASGATMVDELWEAIREDSRWSGRRQGPCKDGSPRQNSIEHTGQHRGRSRLLPELKPRVRPDEVAGAAHDLHDARQSLRVANAPACPSV
jgi:hypothetical protein